MDSVQRLLLFSANVDLLDLSVDTIIDCFVDYVDRTNSNQQKLANNHSYDSEATCYSSDFLDQKLGCSVSRKLHYFNYR